MKKIYIAGKVTGLHRTEVERNFNTLKEYFTNIGYHVISPIDIVVDPDTDWKTAMKICIKALLDCDYIYLMNNARFSKGARLEFLIAKEFEIKIIDSKVAADPTSSQSLLKGTVQCDQLRKIFEDQNKIIQISNKCYLKPKQ